MSESRTGESLSLREGRRPREREKQTPDMGSSPGPCRDDLSQRQAIPRLSHPGAHSRPSLTWKPLRKNLVIFMKVFQVVLRIGCRWVPSVDLRGLIFRSCVGVQLLRSSSLSPQC